MNANDVILLQRATRFKLDSNMKRRVLKLLKDKEEDEKLKLAMDYIYSITKSTLINKVVKVEEKVK